MSTQQNLKSTKKAYADFAAGDEAAVSAYWAVRAERPHTRTPSRFLADEDTVVVLTTHDQDGDEASGCTDILTFVGGKASSAPQTTPGHRRAEVH